MDILMIVIVTIAIVIGLFLLFRQVTLWYFKINQHITMMAEQLKMMNKQTRLLEDIRDELKKKSLKTDQKIEESTFSV